METTATITGIGPQGVQIRLSFSFQHVTRAGVVTIPLSHTMEFFQQFKSIRVYTYGFIPAEAIQPAANIRVFADPEAERRWPHALPAAGG